MASTGSLVVGVMYILSILIQGSLVWSMEDLEPNAQSVPEKIEHGEKGSSEYNVDTIELTGNQHNKVEDETRPHPPWPPRPGRRSFISIKTKKAMPTIMRPGRIIHDSLFYEVKRRLSPQSTWPTLLRPGRDGIPENRPPSLFRPGREDVPKAPPTLFRPGREDVPKKPPTLFRPGRADVPQTGPVLFRPGRQFPYILRPGRSDVPQPQHSVVRPGKRSIKYNMPWTYFGSSVNANVHQKSNTFRQKAQEELAKKTVHIPQQEMSDPNSLEDEPQDF